MVMMKLKFVSVNTAYEADSADNGTAPDWDVKHTTKSLKQLVYIRKVKVDRVVASK